MSRKAKDPSLFWIILHITLWGGLASLTVSGFFLWRETARRLPEPPTLTQKSQTAARPFQIKALSSTFRLLSKATPQAPAPLAAFIGETVSLDRLSSDLQEALHDQPPQPKKILPLLSAEYAKLTNDSAALSHGQFIDKAAALLSVTEAATGLDGFSSERGALLQQALRVLEIPDAFHLAETADAEVLGRAGGLVQRLMPEVDRRQRLFEELRSSFRTEEEQRGLSSLLGI